MPAKLTAEPIPAPVPSVYPMWITDPKTDKKMIVQSHEQHSAVMGIEYGPDGEPLYPELLQTGASKDPLEF